LLFILFFRDLKKRQTQVPKSSIDS